jgi:hypothetical protein
MIPKYCYICKNFTGKLELDTCKAFPNGIPKDILLLKKLHNKIIEGQIGNYIFDEKK